MKEKNLSNVIFVIQNFSKKERLNGHIASVHEGMKERKISASSVVLQDLQKVEN